MFLGGQLEFLTIEAGFPFTSGDGRNPYLSRTELNFGPGHDRNSLQTTSLSSWILKAVSSLREAASNPIVKIHWHPERTKIWWQVQTTRNLDCFVPNSGLYDIFS